MLSKLGPLLSSIESKGAILGLLLILVTAVALEFTGHLSMSMASVLEWVGGSFFGAQSASHLSTGFGQGSGQGRIS